jgi:uncharacterized protein (DUF1684 family)
VGKIMKGLRFAAGALLAVTALAVAPPSAWAAKARPPIVMLVAPNPAVVGTRGEVAVQLHLPRSVLKAGRLAVNVHGPDAAADQSVPLSRVSAGTYEGLFNVPTTGAYRVTARFVSQGRTYTVTKAVTAQKGSPTASALRIVIAVVLFGVAWLFLNRRRR